jgi:tetratricopeptide (TPR) repeat protein
MSLDAWRHYLRALLHQRLKRPERAIAEYRLALGADPGFARAAHRLAFLLAAGLEDGEALHWLNETLRIEPRNAAAWFNLGYFHSRRGRPGEAVAAFRESARLSPRLDTAWYGLGLALAAQGRHGEAAAALERAAALQPMNGEVWYQLGMAQHWAGEAAKVAEVARHLNRFDRRMTRSLVDHSGRQDLEHLVADYDPRLPGQS